MEKKGFGVISEAVSSVMQEAAAANGCAANLIKYIVSENSAL